MSKRKSFVLRLSPEMFAQLEKWAEDEFRSVNGQLEWIVSKSLKEANRLPKKSKNTDSQNSEKGDEKST